MDSKIELAKPRDFGETITDTFGFIRQNFKPLLKYFFIFCGFFVVATCSLTVLLEVKAISFANNTDAFDESNAFSRVFSLLGVYFLLFLFIALEYVIGLAFALLGMYFFSTNENSLSLMNSIFYTILIGLCCILLGVVLLVIFT